MVGAPAQAAGYDDDENEQQTVRFIDERDIYAAGYRYEDLVAAVNVVATKPGYGIIAECVANETAILYTSRGRFSSTTSWSRRCPAIFDARSSRTRISTPGGGRTCWTGWWPSLARPNSLESTAPRSWRDTLFRLWGFRL